MSNTEPPETASDSPRRRKRWPWFAGIAGVLVVALGVGVWYFVFRDDAPPAVSLSDATESVKERATVTTDGSKSGSGSDSLSGTWEIDTLDRQLLRLHERVRRLPRAGRARRASAPRPRWGARPT